MTHITLNTGHAVESPRRAVKDDAVDLLRPLARAGRHPIPLVRHYAVDVCRSPGSALFTVYLEEGTAEGVPIVTCGVAWSAAEAEAVWTMLEKFYHSVAEAAAGSMLAAGNASPGMPAAVPWLGVVLLPGIARGRDAMPWLGDFERCLAWTLIETDASRK